MKHYLLLFLPLLAACQAPGGGRTAEDVVEQGIEIGFMTGYLSRGPKWPEDTRKLEKAMRATAHDLAKEIGKPADPYADRRFAP